MVGVMGGWADGWRGGWVHMWVEGGTHRQQEIHRPEMIALSVFLQAVPGALIDLRMIAICIGYVTYQCVGS